MARKTHRKRRRASSNGNGHLLEGMAISEAYRDAWYAAALARAEEMARDPKIKRLIDEVIDAMLEHLRQGRKA